MKKNPEISLLMKVLAIIGLVIMLVILAGYIFIRVRVPHLLEFSEGIAEYRITVKIDSLQDARFIQGMNGCENLLPVKNSEGIYVSCLDGYIHYLDKDPSGEYRISRSFKAGSAVTGLAMSADGNLFAVIYTCPLDEWKTTGGSVYHINRELTSTSRISENFPGLNGVCIDGQNNLYFTSSNFNFLSPDGKVFRMNRGADGAIGRPVPYFENVGLANGLYYDPARDMIYFSNTLGGTYEFTPNDNAFNEVYLKLKFMESCDDLCTDISGNIWMTDPGQATVKMYNPGTGRLFRFNIEGFGQASSCRIRSENGREMIYISELSKLNKPMSKIFDGRGVLAVPAQTLLKFMEPVLINKTSE